LPQSPTERFAVHVVDGRDEAADIDVAKRCHQGAANTLTTDERA
jgi:hypothetical protein